MEIIYKPVSDLIPYENNPRKNDQAVDYVANSIKEFGFKVPIIVGSDNVIVTGHTRLKAAIKLGLTEVPVIVADDLTEEQINAFRLADNKVAEMADWDFERLDLELETLDFDMSEFGFDIEQELEMPTDLDDYTEKDTVVVSINCGSFKNYESVKERLENLTDEIGGTMSIKMQ